MLLQIVPGVLEFSFQISRKNDFDSVRLDITGRSELKPILISKSDAKQNSYLHHPDVPEHPLSFLK
jgi:hypothetical protein